MSASLDDLRRQHPQLGFAVYAYEPGGPVTLEVHTIFNEIHTFKARSLSGAIDLAFPPDAPFVVTDEPAPQETNVFD